MDPLPSRKVATPARLRAHVGRIVGRAGAALQLGDCRATGRGHLAHKGRTDALHVCSGWRRILRYPLDMIATRRARLFIFAFVTVPGEVIPLKPAARN